MSVCLPSLFVFSRATLDGHGAGRLARRIKRFVMALNESKKYCVSKRGPFFLSSNAFRFLKRMQNKGKSSMKLRPQLHPHYETRLLSARKISPRSRRSSSRSFHREIHIREQLSMHAFTRAWIEERRPTDVSPSSSPHGAVLQMLEIRPPRYIFRERHVTVIWMKKVSVGQTFSEETDRPIRTDFKHRDVLRKIGKEREETNRRLISIHVSLLLILLSSRWTIT